MKIEIKEKEGKIKSNISVTTLKVNELNTPSKKPRLNLYLKTGCLNEGYILHKRVTKKLKVK